MEKFVLPPNWEWAGDWQVAPELSILYDKDSGHSQYMEEVYEQNYRKLPGASWAIGSEEKKPFNWADYVSKKLNSKIFFLQK